MELGVRQIRTAGKGSGSIELTLPAELRDLVGLPCRVMLRDGSRPDIVLQPDLRRALVAFTRLWSAMAAALSREACDASDFPLASFTFGLQPRPSRGETPFLCWRDGLILATNAPHSPIAVSRTLAGCGHTLARSLGISADLANGFGAACGYVLTGELATADAQEACDLAASAIVTEWDRPGATLASACAQGALGEAFWRHGTPVLIAIAEIFQGWTSNPSSHAAMRAAWRRGRAIEMSGG